MVMLLKLLVLPLASVTSLKEFRHAPVGDVVTWAAATLGDDRVLELVAALQQVIDVRASAQAS
jgi:hypothetical protein